MHLYTLMSDYAQETALPPEFELPCPELGKSLALLQSCLIEAGLEYAEETGERRLVSLATDIKPCHISRFVVGFLPFNSITTKEETNSVLFDIFLFFRWLKKRGVPHGLDEIDYQSLVNNLTKSQERCLKLSHFLDEETLKTLDDPPQIIDTLSDMFSVIKIDNKYIYLKGHNNEDPVRLNLPTEILDLVHLYDNLDLVIGDTSEKWVILEAGQVYPKAEQL